MLSRFNDEKTSLIKACHRYIVGDMLLMFAPTHTYRRIGNCDVL